MGTIKCTIIRSMEVVVAMMDIEELKILLKEMKRFVKS